MAGDVRCAAVAEASRAQIQPANTLQQRKPAMSAPTCVLALRPAPAQRRARQHVSHKRNATAHATGRAKRTGAHPLGLLVQHAHPLHERCQPRATHPTCTAAAVAAAAISINQHSGASLPTTKHTAMHPVQPRSPSVPGSGTSIPAPPPPNGPNGAGCIAPSDSCLLSATGSPSPPPPG
jgi:hypothetical protein